MITEIVTFPLPSGTTRKSAVDMYRQTAGAWAHNPDLIRKYYFFDEQRCLGGGIYLWPSRVEASRWHGDDYRTKVKRLYGAYPEIAIFDMLIEIDPATNAIIELS